MKARSITLLAQHVRTGNYYRVRALNALDVENPARKLAVYEQTSATTDRDTGHLIPAGTLWVREMTQFRRKFRVVGISRF